MKWDVRFDPAFATEAKMFSRAAQLEIAALAAILLVGGSKSGTSEKRFYEELIRVADERFTKHLKILRSKDGGKK
jgi:hypothetical protein